MPKRTIKARLHTVIFRGRKARASELRYWALACLTAALTFLWKVLTVLDSLYPSAFWQAVMGPDPVHDLGANGFILLALYVPGAIGFCLVSVGLVAIGQAWKARLLL